MNLKSCVVQLNAKRTWCSRGPQGCSPRAPHQVCSLAFRLGHVLLFLPVSPGFNEAPRGWRTCQRHPQCSSPLEKIEGFALALLCLCDLSAYSLVDFLSLSTFSAAWIHDPRRRDVDIYQISLDGWDLPFMCIQTGVACPHSVPHFSCASASPGTSGCSFLW